MNRLEISIRHSTLSGLIEMQEMFVDTISTVCSDDYSPEQIRVWTSSIENQQRWKDKLAGQYFLIAEFNHKIVGYASLENNDYLDLLYVHRDHQRQGIAARLYEAIENEAIKRKAKVIRSDISKTARRFFEKKDLQRSLPKSVSLRA